MTRLPHALLGTTAIALLLVARPSSAQDDPAAADSAARARTVLLVGVVHDTTGRPLDGAEARVADRVGLTNADGVFVLPVAARDTVQVLVRRIGYRPVDTLLAVAPDAQRVEVWMQMVPSAVQLGTIVVRGQSMNHGLWRTGFYDREKLGSGYFFNPARMERHQGTLTGLLYEVPSLTMQRGRFGESFAFGRSGMRFCRMLVFLDGSLVRWADEVGIESIVHPKDVLAMEVYPRANQMPATLVGPKGDAGAGLASPVSEQRGISLKGQSKVECGAIVIWTKPYEPKQR